MCFCFKRNILQSETKRLTSFCLEWDKTVEMDIPEEGKRQNTKRFYEIIVRNKQLPEFNCDSDKPIYLYL